MYKLETKRLILRDHIPEDLESHARLLMSAEEMYYLQDIQCHTFEEAKENLESALADQASAQRSFYFFRLEERETGAHVGEAGYTVNAFTPVGKLVHMGYFTWKEFWGRGYMTEAVREILRFAFEENDVYRLSTGCLTDNIGSQRVMQKCGLIKEADRREWEWLDGAMHDRVEYRLLRKEYQNL